MPLALLQAVALPPDPGADPVPDWVRFVPAGEFRAQDGRGPWRVADPARVIAASARLAPLVLDENHATDHAQRSGGGAPARGWITMLEARPDGIWGRVEWTPTGRNLMAERAYRAVSPVIEFAKDGTVIALRRAALTNTPAVPELALLTEEDPQVDLTQLCAALNLAGDADEAAILAAARAAALAAQAHAALLTRAAPLAGLGADATGDALVAALTARAAAGDPAQLAATVQQLQTDLATLTDQRATERAVAFVDGQIRAGKPIGGLRDHYIARHKADAAGVEKELAALVSINAGGAVVPPTGDQPGKPTPEEAKLIAMLGVDPDKFAAEKKRLGLTQEAI